MDNEQIRRNLIRVLWVYELLVISTCLYAGFNIATAQGGSVSLAAPLVMIASAELLRIPLAGWSTRLSFIGKLLSIIVILAISVLSFEALLVICEGFLQNRVTTIAKLERDVINSRSALEKKLDLIAEKKLEAAHIQQTIASLTSQSEAILKAHPVTPSFSGKTCGKGVTCFADRQAQDTYKRQLEEDNNQKRQIDDERKAYQSRVDSLLAQGAGVDASGEQNTLSDRLMALNYEKSQSPMHRLTAAMFNISVDKVTSDQFEVLKKYAVFGLAGAFSVLSATVSWVAHMTPKSDKPTKLSRAFRAYLARKRKALVRVVEVLIEKIIEKLVEVPVEKIVTEVIHKYVPYDYRKMRSVMPDIDLDRAGEKIRHLSEVASVSRKAV